MYLLNLRCAEVLLRLVASIIFLQILNVGRDLKNPISVFKGAMASCGVMCKAIAHFTQSEKPLLYALCVWRFCELTTFCKGFFVMLVKLIYKIMCLPKTSSPGFFCTLLIVVVVVVVVVVIIIIITVRRLFIQQLSFRYRYIFCRNTDKIHVM